MTTKEALLGFYQFNNLNLADDFKTHCVRVYIGCMLAPVPNVNARKKYLKFHDLHHVIAGYGIQRVGESEVSAWELGSRSCRKPLIAVMNLFALSTGFILKPQRVIQAYYRGCRSKNLYYLSESFSEKEIDEIDIESIRSSHLEIQVKFFRQLEFLGYLIISMFIHVAMLFIGKGLLIAENIKKQWIS